MKTNQLTLQQQKELNRLILEDKTFNLLKDAVGKVLEKAKIKGVKDGAIIYDNESMTLISGYRLQIEERINVIESFFNGNEMKSKNLGTSEINNPRVEKPNNCKEEFDDNICESCRFCSSSTASHPGGSSYHTVKVLRCDLGYWEDCF